MRALEGRAAIITGANQGLGLAIARGYVEAGASVLLCARDHDRLTVACDDVATLAGRGQIVEAEPADVSNAADVDRVASRAFALFPRVHVLVNNAGVYGPMGPIEEVDWDAWTRAMEINVYGSVLPCRALLPHFKKHRYGKIVQLSGGGATNPLPRITAYAASKAALAALAATLADEWESRSNLRVNAVVPGPIRSPLRMRTHPGEDRNALPAPDALVPLYLQLIAAQPKIESGVRVDAQAWLAGQAASTPLVRAATAGRP